MKPFVFDLKRDASDSIRGFVYQVEHTILSWLDLRPRQHLQLEAGEDIDEVCSFLQRKTVQIKDVDGSVSLTSGAPYIANAVAALRNNPGISLTMRFVTTAMAGHEQGNPFGPGVKGIDAWSQAREADDEAGAKVFLASLKLFLGRLSRTQAYVESAWDAFQIFVREADEAALFDLVKRFEWQTGSVPQAEMQPHLLSRLADLGVPEIERQACLHRLFFRVFQLLSKSGSKVLTVEDRQDALTSVVTSQESFAIQSLIARLADYDLRIGAIESRIDVVENRLEPLEALVAPSDLLAELGVAGQGNWTAAGGARTLTALIADLGDLSPPPPDPNWIITSNLGLAVKSGVGQTWLNVTGPIASGKSIVALQLADTKGRIAWVRLGAANQTVRLDALRIVLGGSFESDWSSALAALPTGSVLVLDNARVHEEPVATRIAQIAACCLPFGHQIVTTSTRHINTQVPNSFYASVTLRAWDEGDTQRMLAMVANAITPDLLPSLARIVGGIASGQPALVRLIAHDISQHNGQFNQAFFEKLFHKRAASALGDEVVDRLSSLQNGDRELLYRLAVPTLPFSDRYVNNVARENVPILDPLIARNRLLDGWLIREHGRLSTNSLVSGHMDQLAPETLKRCHHWAAVDILENSTVNQNDLLALINHSLFAGENEMALLHMTKLIEISRKAGAEMLNLYGSVVLAYSVPELPPGFELLLRAERAGLARELGRNMDPELDRIDELVPHLREEDAAVAALAYVKLADRDSPLPFKTQATLFRFALKSPVKVPRELALETLLMSLAYNLRSAADVHIFLSIAREMSPQILAQIIGIEHGELAREAFEPLWLTESNKPEGEQNWQRVLNAATALLDGAVELKQSTLAVLAARIKAVVLGEYLHQVEGAVEMLDSLSESDWLTAEDQWLLSIVAGLQLIYAGSIEEGVRRLQGGLTSISVKRHQRFQFWARLELMRHIVGSSPAGALHQIDQARNLAQSSYFTDHDRFRCEAEQMLIEWVVGGAIRAWPYADRAARILEEAKLNDVIMSDHVQYGHAVTYISVQLRTGSPPPFIETGEEYGVPFVGMFGTAHKERVSLYGPTRRAFVTWQLANFADGVSDREGERYWLARLESWSASPGLEVLAAVAMPKLLRIKLQAGAVTPAVALFTEVLRTHVAMHTAYQAREPVKPLEGFDVSIWVSRATPEQARDIAIPLFRYFAVLAVCILIDSAETNSTSSKLFRDLKEALDAANLVDVLTVPRAAIVKLLDIVETQGGSQRILEFGEQEGKVDTSMLAYARLLASVQPDCDLQVAVALQESVTDLARSLVPIDPDSFDDVFTTMLLHFWRRAFERGSFKFQAPRFALQWLEEAGSSGPLAGRPSAILKAMKLAVGA